MKHGSIALLAALSLSLLMAGGCARNEVIPKEEAPAAVTKPAAPQTKAPAAAPAASSASKPKTTDDQSSSSSAQKSEQAASKAVAGDRKFETIYFDFDKSELKTDSRDALTKNADIMLKKKNLKAVIEGHCDERGSAEYNLALGERRAKSAMQYLITLGVAADRLSTVSYGKEKPAVDGHDDAAWAKNRRAEFK